MNLYCVYFSGVLELEAEDEEDARGKAFFLLPTDCDIDSIELDETLGSPSQESTPTAKSDEL